MPKRSTNVIQPNLIVSAKELGEILGLTQVRVQQLAKEDHVMKEGRGRYNLQGSIRRYMAFLRDSAQGRQTPEEDADFKKERAGLYREKRLRAKAENDLFFGTLHEGPLVEALWNDQLSNAKSKLRTLKTKIAPLVQHETELPVIEQIIGEEIDTALEDLNEYDQSKFIEETLAAFQANGESLSSASEVED